MYTGTLPECLRVFRQSVPDSNSVIARFCGVTPSTASGWGSTEPKGKALNKLCVLLRYHDIVVGKYASLSETVLYLQDLVAFEVLNAKDACAMGLGKTEQYLWRALQGKHTPTAIKSGVVSLESLQRDYGSEMNENISICRLEGTIPKEGAVSQLAQDQTETALPTLSAEPNALRDAALVAAGNLLAATPALEVLAAAGPDGKSLLEDIIGQERFWRTLDMLKAMSSRQANKFYRGGSANG